MKIFLGEFKIVWFLWLAKSSIFARSNSRFRPTFHFISFIIRLHLKRKKIAYLNIYESRFYLGHLILLKLLFGFIINSYMFSLHIFLFFSVFNFSPFRCYIRNWISSPDFYWVLDLKIFSHKYTSQEKRNSSRSYRRCTLHV